MKWSIVLLSLIALNAAIVAQPVVWTVPASGSGESETTAIAVDQDGNVVSTGVFSGTLIVGSSNFTQTLVSTASSNNIFISKQNGEGQLLWAKSFGSQQDDKSGDIVVDHSGNIYFLGSFKSTVTLPQGASPGSLSPSGTEDTFLLKIDPNGNIQSVIQFGGNEHFRGTGLAIKDEELYVAGVFSGTVDFNPSSWTNSFTATSEFGDIFILKLNTSGEYQWLRRLQGPGEKRVSGIDIANNNRLWLTGYYTETLVPSSSGTIDMIQSEGGKDIFIATYYFGQFSRLWTIGGPSDDVTNDLVTWKNSEDSFDQAVFITGTFQDSCNFKMSGFSSDYRQAVGSNDAFILGMRSSTIVTYWVKTIGSTGNEEGLAVTTDENGNVFAGGSFENEITLSYLDGIVPYEAVNMSDGFVHKYNNDGEFRYFKAFQGDQNAVVTGLAAAPDNALLACGDFSGTVNFDTFTANHVYSAGSSSKHFNLKLEHCDELPTHMPASPCYEMISPSGDFTWNESGGYLDFSPVFGTCNDAVYVDLDLATSYDTIDVFVCDYYELPSGKAVITSAGTYTDTIPNHVGCDSVITANVVILNPVVEECDTQVLEWAKLIPHGQSWQSEMVLDYEENIYLAGAYYIHKYDSLGNFLQTFPILNKDIATDGVNFLYTTFHVSYDGHLIHKATLDGDIVWDRFLEGDGSLVTFSYVAPDTDGNVIVAGSFKGDMDFDPGIEQYILSGPNGYTEFAPFIVKLNANGELDWAHQLVGNMGIVTGVDTDLNNNIYITGIFEGEIDFDPGPVEFIIESYQSPQTLDYRENSFVAKYSPDGEFQWVRAFGNSSTSGTLSRQLAVDDLGNAYAAGEFWGLVEFISDSEEFTLDTGSWLSKGLFVVKINAQGDYEWTKAYTGIVTPNARPNDITLDKEGSVYLTGDFGAQIDFDPGEGEYIITQGFGGPDVHAFLSKLDANGEFVWAKHIDSQSHTNGYCIAVSEDMSVYYSGKSSVVPANYLKGQGDYWVGASGQGGHLAKFQPCYKNTSFQEFAVCDSLVGPNGQVWNSDGVYSILQEYTDGCDSLHIYHLNITSTNDTLAVNTCESYQWSANGDTYYTSGIYTENLTNISGCDSVVTIDLTINMPTSGTTNATACDELLSPSGNYVWTESGAYVDTVANHLGCDSIVTINLTINEKTFASQSVESCFEFHPPGGNQVWSSSGNYLDIIPNSMGCDSIISFEVLIKEIDYSISLDHRTLNLEAEDDVTIQWVNCSDGFQPIAGEIYPDFLAASSGHYAAIVTQESCIDTTQCFHVTGIESAGLQDLIVIYPNPTTGNVTIDLSRHFENTTIQVYNAIGKLLSEESSHSGRYLMLNINHARGLYYIRIATNTGETAVLNVVKM